MRLVGGRSQAPLSNVQGMDLDSIFASNATRAVFAIVLVLALIPAVVWALRRFGGSMQGAGNLRGRQPRLAVVDQAQIDTRRSLLIIRRDNVEHLVMVGGPTDVVVETNIVRTAVPTREATPARAAGAADTLPRPVPLDDATLWPLQPEPGPRPRPNIPEDVGQWALQPEPQLRPEPRRAPDPLTGLAAELSARPAPARPAPEPPRPAPAPAVSPETAAADQNLAEMAYRLEAALRRPAADTRLAAETIARTEPPPLEKAPDPARAPRVEPRAARPEPKVEPPKPEPAKPAFTSLEQEMASLLGRPSGKGP